MGSDYVNGAQKSAKIRISQKLVIGSQKKTYPLEYITSFKFPDFGHFLLCGWWLISELILQEGFVSIFASAKFYRLRQQNIGGKKKL